MENLIELGNSILYNVVTMKDNMVMMKDELHITNKIAISVSIVNIVTLVVIFWGVMH